MCCVGGGRGRDNGRGLDEVGQVQSWELLKPKLSSVDDHHQPETNNQYDYNIIDRGGGKYM